MTSLSTFGLRVAAPVPGAEAAVGVVGERERAQREVAGERAPAEHRDRELEVARLREVGRERHRLHFRLDADAREELRDGLRDLVVVEIAVVRRREHGREALRVAGRGEELPRAVDVVGLRLEARDVAEDRRCDEVRRRHRGAVHHAVDDRLPVHRLRHRFPHARVGERVAVERPAALVGHAGRHVAALVEGEEDRAPGDLLLEAEARRRADALQIRGWHVLDHVEVVGEERGDARAVVRHDAEDDPVPGRLRAAVGVVAHELDAVAAGEARELVRPGADRRFAGVEVLGAGAGRRLLRHDEHRVQVVRHHRVRRRGLQADRVAVDDLLRDDRPGEGGERAGARRERRRPVDRERDVLGGELRAVAELHALAELELPGRRIDRAPRLGEAGDEPHVLVDVRERLEDVPGDVVVRRDVDEVRVDRGDVGGHADAEVGRSRRRRGEERGEDDDGKAAGDHAGAGEEAARVAAPDCTRRYGATTAPATPARSIARWTSPVAFARATKPFR